MMTENEQESSGGVVFCSSEFAGQLDEFSKLFNHKQKMAEAERFAMAIGIAKNCRMPKDEWKDVPNKRKGTISILSRMGANTTLKLYLRCWNLSMNPKKKV